MSLIIQRFSRTSVSFSLLLCTLSGQLMAADPAESEGLGAYFGWGKGDSSAPQKPEEKAAKVTWGESLAQTRLGKWRNPDNQTVSHAYGIREVRQLEDDVRSALNDTSKSAIETLKKSATLLVKLQGTYKRHMLQLSRNTPASYIEQLGAKCALLEALVTSPDNMPVVMTAAKEDPGLVNTLFDLFKARIGVEYINGWQRGAIPANAYTGLSLVMHKGNVSEAIVDDVFASGKVALQTLQALINRVTGMNYVEPVLPQDREGQMQLVQQLQEGYEQINALVKQKVPVDSVEFTGGRWMPKQQNAAAGASASSSSSVTTRAETNEKSNALMDKHASFMQKFEPFLKRYSSKQLLLYGVGVGTAIPLAIRNRVAIHNAATKAMMMTYQGGKWVCTKWVEAVEWTVAQGARGAQSAYAYVVGAADDASACNS